MAQTVTTCPRCHSQMAANIQQVFDLYNDPADKDRLLSGQVNVAVCPSCGYRSAVGVPLVYHDPEKELLLTYFPAEAGVAINEQERILGPLINQVVNRLPMEERKGYLLQPQSMLTYETLLEKVLEADGITKEMLKEQEDKVKLLRRLLTASDESIPEIISQEVAQIDQAFFGLFSNLQSSAVQMQDQASLKKLKTIQDILLKETPYGRELKVKADSTQKALTDLQELGEKLNRDSLLDLVIAAGDDTYLQTLAGLARNGMDYEFFSKLTAKITQAEGEEKERLTATREKLLNMTAQIDTAIAEQKSLRKQVFDALIKEENLEEGVAKYARAIDDAFMEVAHAELDDARKKGDFMRSGKVQKLLDTIEAMSKMPPEIEFLEQLVEKNDVAEITAMIDENKDKVNDAFKQLLETFIGQVKAIPEQKELLDKLELIQKIVAL